MRLKVIFLCAVALVFGGLTVKGYDLVVTMVVEETNAKIFDLSPEARMPVDLALISRPQKNEADSTYCFKGLPNEKILISYMLGSDLWSEDVTEPTDSITIAIPRALLPNALKEVVVVGNSSYMDDEKIVAIPTSKEKKISSDGASLLRNMAIGALKVSPIDDSITTSSGEAVATFIDFLPASPTDVANIRTSDVRRVEILDYPNDPRFGGAHHVVNFIMIKYEYGGYTKASDSQRFVYDMGDYNAYSKFAYRDMIFDAGVRYNYAKTKHIGSQTNSTYDFGDEKVAYEKVAESSRYKIGNLTGFARAVYQSKGCIISNTLDVSSSEMPESNSDYRESFDSPAYSSGTSAVRNSSSNLSWTWNGNYQLFLPKNYALILTPEASYGRFKNNYLYVDDDDEIRNDVRENAWRASVNARLRKMFGAQSASIALYSGVNGNDMDYAGTNPDDVDARYYYAGAWMMGDLRFGKFSVMPSVRLGFEKYKFDDLSVDATFASHYLLNAQYFISGKHRLNMTSELYYMTVPVNQMGPNIQIQDQINAIEGNPYLKPSINGHVKMQYTCFPVNNVYLSALCGFSRHTRMLSNRYEPLSVGPHQYMVRMMVNNGTQSTFQYQASASVSLFKRSLNLWGSLNGSTISKHSGVSPYSGTTLSYSFQASYSFSNMYALAAYSSKGKNIHTNWIEDTPQYWFFEVGWGNGNLNLSGRAYNPFSSSYKGARREIDTSNYFSYTQDYHQVYFRSFEVSVTYSFSYGKKVDRSSESSNVSGVQSGMLK